VPPSAVIHSVDITLERTDQALVSETLNAILHSIFFHRIFGNVQPFTRDILDVTFPYADDPDLQTLIDSKTSAFIRYIESLSNTPTPVQALSSTDVSAPTTQITKDGTIKSQIAILFYEKVTRRASWWASKSAESEVCWEKWELNCGFLPISRNERDKQRARSVMENQLSSALRRIVVLTQKTDHIPPITTNEANPFPYQIIIPAAPSQMGMEGEGWGAVLKKTLFDATTGPS